MIQIAFSLNKEYIQHCGVLCTSLFLNNQSSSFHITCLVDFPYQTDAEYQLLSAFITSKGHTLQTSRVDELMFNKLKLTCHFKPPIYYRLMLPEVLDDNISKIIYLDSDILALGKIDELWNTDLKQFTLAAVNDNTFTDYDRLNLLSKNGYFSSGVMLLNIDLWKKEGIHKKVLNYIETQHETLFMPDQDALNAVLKDRWIHLDSKWNFMSNQPGNKLNKKDIRILHFAGALKPWNTDHYLKLFMEYNQYLNMSPWKNSKIRYNYNWKNKMNSYLAPILLRLKS